MVKKRPRAGMTMIRDADRTAVMEPGIVFHSSTFGLVIFLSFFLKFFFQLFFAFGFRFFRTEAPALFLLFGGHIQSQCAAGVHDVMRVEVIAQHADHVHGGFADLFLQPGGGLFAHTVMVAHGSACLQDGFEDAVLQRQVLVDIADARDEDEIQVDALRVGVREVRHADRPRAGFDHLAHVVVHLFHLRPVHTAFERVDHDAKIHQVFAHEGIGKAAALPGLGHAERRQGKGAVFFANALDLARDQAREIPVAVDHAEQQAALHGLVAQRAQQLVGDGVVDVIGAHGHVGFFGVRKAEHRRVAEFALHDLAAGSLGFLPVLEQVRIAPAVCGVPVAHPQGHAGQNAEGAFAAHHHLVEIRAGGSAGEFLRFEHTNGGDVLLGDDHVLDLAVVGGVLPGAARDHPAAHRGMLEGLGKMTGGVAPAGVQGFGGVL